MFNLSKEQLDQLKEWQKGRNESAYSGASGGRWTFSFTPTSLGVITKVTDNLQHDSESVLDLTDYDW